MPQKDDSLSRLQAQLSEVLTRVSEVSAEGRLDEALALIWAEQRNVLGLEPTLLNRLASADLLRLLGPTGAPDLERTLACADLLSAEFGVRTLQDTADPAQAEKALELFFNMFAAEPGFAPSYAGRLDVLTQGLLNHGYEAAPATRRALAESYRAAGRFGEAENWLYRWQRLEPDAATSWAETFYRELLGLSDEALIAGGLPRAEVEEGLADVTRAST